MTKKYFKRIGLALLLSAYLQAQAVTVSLSPTSQPTTAGSSVSANLVISGLGSGAAPSLGTFDIDVSFDSSILGFTGATFGNQLDILGLGSLQAVTPRTGGVNLFELSLDLPTDLDTLQAGSFTLATLSFNALAVGTSALGLSINALGDSLGNALAADTVNASVVVAPISAVPEPSTYALMGLGLAGLMLVTRRNAARAASTKPN